MRRGRVGSALRFPVRVPTRSRCGNVPGYATPDSSSVQGRESVKWEYTRYVLPEPMSHDPASTDQPHGFPLTRDSVLVQPRREAREKRERSWESLAAAYWRPAYCHIRLRWNVSREDAQDLTQDFFLRALGGSFFEEYDPGRARFRTFLRPCLDRFLSNEQRNAGREKRGGGIIFLPIDVGEIEADLLANGNPDSDPDQTFHREWIRSLFILAVDALRAVCAAAGKEVQFSIFERGDLLPD